jgi:phosphatidylglycerophosphate synthase
MGGERVEESRQRTWSVADLLTASRIPLAIIFVVVPDTAWRIACLWGAGITDLFDGAAARRWGSSRLGGFLDAVADKVFIGCAFAVVLVEGTLAWWEVVAVLARDLLITFGFVGNTVFKLPPFIDARASGKFVTIGQLLTLLAFLTHSPLLRPVAWITGAIALYAVVDYLGAARRNAPDA